MYSITVQSIDGHDGLGEPFTTLVAFKVDAVVALHEWEKENYVDDEEEFALLVAKWDGKESFHYKNGDGESITVQKQVKPKKK